jgi:hypothetical protein
MKKTLGTSIIALCLMCSSAIHAEDSKGYAPESTERSEIFKSRVLRVHHLIEGDLQYLAYTVDWRGHEVIVVATNVDEILKEGDEIRCQMRSAPLRHGDGKKAGISFWILPARTGNDAARLKAVADEVNRRRAAKEAKAEATESEKKN